MSPPSEQVEKISKFFRFLRDEKTLSFSRLSYAGRTAASYEEQKIRRENLSGRYRSGGPTRGSETVGELRFGFPGLEAALAFFPLHVLIGSALSTIKGARTTAKVVQADARASTQKGAYVGRAAVASAVLPRRRKNPPRAPDASQTALASTGWGRHCILQGGTRAR